MQLEALHFWSLHICSGPSERFLVTYVYFKREPSP